MCININGANGGETRAHMDAETTNTQLLLTLFENIPSHVIQTLTNCEEF